MLKFYSKLFVSACRLGIILHFPFKPHIFGHYWLTFSGMIVFASILMLIKWTLNIDFDIGKVVFALIVIVPIWLINDLLFLREKNM